jgi:hypothetical protein
MAGADQRFSAPPHPHECLSQDEMLIGIFRREANGDASYSLTIRCVSQPQKHMSQIEIRRGTIRLRGNGLLK